MDPGQQSSSPIPFSDEETQLFYNIRDSTWMKLSGSPTLLGWWDCGRRRLEAFEHHRSPQELEAKFGHYRPKRPRKKRKRAMLANEQEQEQPQCSSALQQRQQQAQDRLARSQEVEATRKKLLEKIDLNAFFSKRTSWKNAIISLRLCVNTTTDTEDNTVETSNRPRRSRRAHKPNSRVTGPEWSQPM